MKSELKDPTVRFSPGGDNVMRAIDAARAKEALTRAAFCRRAVMLDLTRRGAFKVTASSPIAMEVHP